MCTCSYIPIQIYVKAFNNRYTTNNDHLPTGFTAATTASSAYATKDSDNKGTNKNAKDAA